jgi:hypothetical protein
MVLSFACKNNPIKPEQWQINLTLVETSCTEAYLKLQVGADISERTITLKRDNIELWTRRMDATETVITDTSLLPGYTYTYTATLISPPPIWIGTNSTSQVQVRTMDTTSHDFTWQTFTLGDGTGSSVLLDVTIINDSCVWAVGEIHRNDTTFNVAKWDGTQWELKRIQSIICGSSTYTVRRIYTIFTFNENDIWYSDGGEMIHWNGTNYSNDCSMNSILAGAINKIWGSSSNDLYAVGDGGNIIHYNGSTWTKIESGTTLTLNDVWGRSNKFVGENIVMIPASEKYTGGEKRLLRLRNGTIIDLVPWSMQDRRIHSVWFDQQSPIFTSGGGVFQSREYGTWNEMSVPLTFTNCIRGNASNDLIVVGDYGIVAHYNGVIWRVFDELAITVGNYESVSIKKNFIVIVGFSGSNAIIVAGRRD